MCHFPLRLTEHEFSDDICVLVLYKDKKWKRLIFDFNFNPINSD